MGRSVRVVAIAAAMLISFPAAAFADTGDGRAGATTTADCPTTGATPGGGAGSGGPVTGGDGDAGSGKPDASAAPGRASPGETVRPGAAPVTTGIVGVGWLGERCGVRLGW